MTVSKRVFDIFLAALLLALLMPVIVVLCVILWLVQGRPVFYVSERMKTPDQAFDLWKFRTMTADTGDSGVSGGDKSARITPLGRFLRSSRLDELPQLWNILRGDLSFVGPRPPLRTYVERFPDLYARVLRSRPGVTGLATLHAHRWEERLLSRCATAAETDAVYARRCVPRKARLDLLYQRHANLCVDVMILAATLAAVIKRRGDQSS